MEESLEGHINEERQTRWKRILGLRRRDGYTMNFKCSRQRVLGYPFLSLFLLGGHMTQEKKDFCVK